MNTTGKLIAFYRHIYSVKQEHLSYETEISQSTISQIENDKVSPTVNQLTKISRALKINSSDLLPKSNTNYPTLDISNANFVEIQEERKIYRELLAAKDKIIKIQEDLISKMNIK
ncbi:MAG: helix-turn-helix transcriptional regulator [Bacteroidota bacterium]